jgi:hypothetical protein
MGYYEAINKSKIYAMVCALIDMEINNPDNAGKDIIFDLCSSFEHFWNLGTREIPKKDFLKLVKEEKDKLK